MQSEITNNQSRADGQCSAKCNTLHQSRMQFNARVQKNELIFRAIIQCNARLQKTEQTDTVGQCRAVM